MTEVRSLLRSHRLAEIEVARRTLTAFMLERADETARDVGFNWRATSDAPNTYEALTSAFGHSVATGAPLPISSEHNDCVVYTSAAGNIAFRFVHDVHHVKFGLSFKAVDELELALWHLGELGLRGFEPTSLPWRLLHADLVGQALLINLAGQFPPRQQDFVRRCLLGGFEHGLVAEIRELGGPHAAG